MSAREDGARPGARRAGDPERSIGAFLALQRRLRGITLEELEAITRVPRRSLERLEAGAFDAEFDGFTRGFVRTVSIALGLDPDEALSRLGQEPEPSPRALPQELVRRATLVLAGAFALAVAGALLFALAGGGHSGPAPAGLPPAGEVVLRRDAVRELAEAVDTQAPTRSPVAQTAEEGGP